MSLKLVHKGSLIKKPASLAQALLALLAIIRMNGGRFTDAYVGHSASINYSLLYNLKLLMVYQRVRW